MSLGHTYYDAVGLLAICDAIDTVEGIPFKPTGPPRTSPAAMLARARAPAMTLPAMYPPLGVAPSAKANVPQHPLLTHVAPASTVSAKGSISYTESRRTAYPDYSAGPADVRMAPNGPVLGGPGHRAGHQMVGPGPMGPGMALAASSVAPGSYPSYPPYGGHPGGPSLPAVTRSPAVGPGAPTVTSASSNSPSPAPQGATAYKIEECHVCGRTFKGPKASTHKQQHIRRLHPNEYTPKRGGKKRVVV